MIRGISIIFNDDNLEIGRVTVIIMFDYKVLQKSSNFFFLFNFNVRPKNSVLKVYPEAVSAVGEHLQAIQFW